MAVLDRDGQRLFPSWSELLLSAADRLDSESKSPEANVVRAVLKATTPDFLYAASRARTALGPLWYELLRDKLDVQHNQIDDATLELARCVWELGSQLLITTNYDEVLRWACPRINDLQSWDIEAPAEQVQLMQKGLERPTVWHLHGRISNAAQIILALDGYKLLYPEASQRETKYKASLETLRHQIASKSLLFVGFSLEDEFFGMQLRGVNEIFSGAPGPHYALIREGDIDRLRSHNLPVEPVTFKDFGSPLLEILRTLAVEAKDNATSAPIVAAVKSHVRVPDYDPSNPVFHVPFRQKGNEIVGQEQALQNVRKQLLKGKRTAIGQTAAFQGLGGLGKTQLAVEYAYRHREDYPNGVIWINADQDIDAQLIEIAHKGRWIAPASEHKYKLQIAQQRLRSYSDCLIVFDNLEDRNSIGPYLPEPEANPHILVTSRKDFIDFVPVPLDPLDERLSLELLLQEARRHPTDDDERFAALEIVRDLGGLPLALELAGAYLSHRETVSFRQYCDLLRQDFKTAFPGSLSSFTEHEADLHKTLRLSEDLLEQETTLRQVLDLLTWSGSAPMSTGLISRLLGSPTEIKLVEALALASTLRLLQKTEGSDSYSLHRLVGEVRRSEVKLDARIKWVDAICQQLGDWFQERRNNFSNLPLLEAEIDHLDAWQKHASLFAASHASRLMWLQAYPAYHRGRYAEARTYVVEAQKMFKIVASTNRELKANLLNDLAFVDDELGDFRSVLEHHKEALRIRQQLFRQKHPDIAISLSNVGGWYGQVGELKLALEFSEQALAMQLELFGEQHPDIATSLGNIGSWYGNLGDLDRALEFSEQALAMRRELFGEQHPDFATSLNNLGNVYGKLGDQKRALEFLKHAFAMRRELFGEKHPDIANSLLSIGNCYGKQGDFKRALEFSDLALTMQRELFGEKHPAIATSVGSIGTWYGQQGNQERALEFLLQALVMLRELFGERHPSIATLLINIGTAYGRQGDQKRDLEFTVQGFVMRRELFGDNHPDTVKSAADVAVCHINLGQRLEAYELVTQFLAALPPNHQNGLSGSRTNCSLSLSEKVFVNPKKKENQRNEGGDSLVMFAPVNSHSPQPLDRL